MEVLNLTMEMEKSKASFVMRSSEESWSMHKSVNQ